jgi:hypothetical protein
VPGNQPLDDASGAWFRRLVRAVFGSWHRVAKQRMIRDLFSVVPKGSSRDDLQRRDQIFQSKW